MPSLTLKRKKKEISPDRATMATSGRYRKVNQENPSPLVGDYGSACSGSVVRKTTITRRSEQSKNSRSLSVPSLHSVDNSSANHRQPSPPHKLRSNSVRGPSSKKGALSFKVKLAKLFGSHSNLSGQGGGMMNDHSPGTYRQLPAFRPRSIGGSSDCSSSSLTSGPQQSEFSRHNSLRDSSRSRISQNSVFSARQESYDSADIFNYSVHGPTVPSESALRPRSIACMQRSGSNSSLKATSLHSVTDARYHSLAALPPRVNVADSFFDEHIRLPLTARAHRHVLARAQFLPDENLPADEADTGAIKPSDPEYPTVAQNLMSCSPQPKPGEYSHYQRTDNHSDSSQHKSVNDTQDRSSLVRSLPSPYSVHSRAHEGAESRRSATPDPSHSYSLSGSAPLPSGWEVAMTPTRLRYYIDHNTQSTHWKLPNDPDDALSLPTGWEVVKSSQYGIYYVNHNNHTAQYQHPIHQRSPPPYIVTYTDEDEAIRDRKTPIRSHSHRSSYNHRVFDPNASLPRRSKSFRDPALDLQADLSQVDEQVQHTRQLSTMTYVPPSPFQIAEIPLWLKEYVEAPFGSEKDRQIQWMRYNVEDLNGLDTMTKRLLRKNLEQIVKQFEYHRVSIQQEMDKRLRERNRRAIHEKLNQTKKAQMRKQRPPASPSLLQPGQPLHPPNGISSSLLPPQSVQPSTAQTNSSISSHQQLFASPHSSQSHSRSALAVSRSRGDKVESTTVIGGDDLLHGLDEAFV